MSLRSRATPAVNPVIRVNDMKIIIDRFEEDFAVCELENGKFLNLPKELFPDAEEGNVINISVDATETEKRKENANKRLHSLFGNRES